jgi:dolichyl-phosphate beta-glucosyltransferase
VHVIARRLAGRSPRKKLSSDAFTLKTVLYEGYMGPTPDLSIVIPAYNEELRIAPTIRDIVRYCQGRERAFELILVDDGSRDGTTVVGRLLCEKFPQVKLIRLATNHGKGYAVRTGVVNALGRTILFADADGATPIEELERLESALDSGANIAVGSRALRADGVQVRAKLYRRLIGRSFHFMVESLADTGVKDTQCGFKLFQSRAAQDLFSRMRMNGFSFDVEVLLMARQRGYRVAEVPINWAHQPGSKVRLPLDSLRMAADLVRIRMHCFRGEYQTPHSATWSHQLKAGLNLRELEQRSPQR